MAIDFIIRGKPVPVNLSLTGLPLTFFARNALRAWGGWGRRAREREACGPN